MNVMRGFRRRESRAMKRIMRVLPIACFSDNYAYLVSADGSDEALVVDPSEAGPVLSALSREGLRLKAILCTHHHWDHVGGNDALVSTLGALPVYAHESSLGVIPQQNTGVSHERGFSAAGLFVRPLHVPGHTLDALAYVIEDCVFTGDTMFAAGCGRLFEGTAEQMYDSLCNKIAKLPGSTKVFCGHEYTVGNLRFALHAEPDNEAAIQKLKWAQSMRERAEPTVPSTIAEELQTNPFLRCSEPSLSKHFSAPTPQGVLSLVRKAKDNFR